MANSLSVPALLLEEEWTIRVSMAHRTSADSTSSFEKWLEKDKGWFLRGGGTVNLTVDTSKDGSKCKQVYFFLSL